MSEAVVWWRTRPFWLVVAAVIVVGIGFLAFRGDGSRPPASPPAAVTTPN